MQVLSFVFCPYTAIYSARAVMFPIIFSRLETGNSIKGTIPSAFGKLTNLKVLILSANSFSGHLPTFSTFTKLEVLLG